MHKPELTDDANYVTNRRKQTLPASRDGAGGRGPVERTATAQYKIYDRNSVL